MSVLVEDYEVFKNEKEALAFFFYHQPELDQNNPDGPFLFVVEGNNILAGTKEHHITISEVSQEVIEIAKNRGNLLLMEFEDQQPVRATPCYLAESF